MAPAAAGGRAAKIAQEIIAAFADAAMMARFGRNRRRVSLRPPNPASSYEDRDVGEGHDKGRYQGEAGSRRVLSKGPMALPAQSRYNVIASSTSKILILVRFWI
jgi:hypothetical protein